MTIAAMADLVSRVVLTIITFYFSISSRKIFYVGTAINIILRNGKFSKYFVEIEL